MIMITLLLPKIYPIKTLLELCSESLPPDLHLAGAEHGPWRIRIKALTFAFAWSRVSSWSHRTPEGWEIKSYPNKTTKSSAVNV